MRNQQIQITLMVDNNNITSSMIEEGYTSSGSDDILSSIHHNSIGAIALKDLDRSQRNLSFDHSPKQGQTSMFEGTPSRKLSPPPRNYITPMPGSAGLSRNNHVINKKDSEVVSQTQYLHVAPSMVDLSMTRQSIQLRQEQDQLQYMMKVVRDEKAQIVKQLAVIEQQCELLKLQLAEAHQRERTQSQMFERLQSALKQQVTDAEQKLQNQESSKVEVDSDHPNVKQILHFHLGQAQDKLHAERENFQQKIYQLEREVQKAKHDTQNSQRDQVSQKQDFEQKLRSMEQDLKRQENGKQDELRNLKNRLQDKIKNLENEIENLRAEEQTERYALLNKHIEQAAQLNNQIKKFSRENSELLNQSKKVEIQRDLELEAKQHLQKEIEMRSEDITELEQALQETQFQLQRLDQSCKAEMIKSQEEIERLLDVNFSLQERAQMSKTKQLTSTQKSSHWGGSSGRSVLKTNDYFSTTTSALKRQDLKSNRSLSQKKVGQSQDVRDMSYTRMCKELEESLIVPEENTEKLAKLQQLVAHFRSTSKRVEVQYRDLKLKYHQEVEQLQNTIKTEKKRRAALYEEKMERSNQLLQQIGERDTMIFQLTKKVSSLQKQSGFQQTVIGGTFNSAGGGPSTDFISEYTSMHQTATKEPIKREIETKRRSTLMQRSFTNTEPGFTDQAISRKDSKPMFALKGQTKVKRVIVKKLIKPQQMEIPILRLDQDSISPYYMSEGSTTRLPITSTEKKLIEKDQYPQIFQAQLSSRNEQLKQQESSEIVNYETQLIEGVQIPEVTEKEPSEDASLENDYYRVDNQPTADNHHLDKIQTLVQQNNVMLDMQNIFGSDSSERGGPRTRQQQDLRGGPDLQNSLMSIAKMRYVDTLSNDRDRADSLENLTQYQKPIVITKPSSRCASSNQLPRRTSVNSMSVEKSAKKKNQPNIPPKPVTMSKKMPTPLNLNSRRVSPTPLKKSISQKPPK